MTTLKVEITTSCLVTIKRAGGLMLKCSAIYAPRELFCFGSQNAFDGEFRVWQCLLAAFTIKCYYGLHKPSLFITMATLSLDFRFPTAAKKNFFWGFHIKRDVPKMKRRN